ncbi:MAG TPA: DUF2779 domain-containing protein [Bacteroidales bacterium]|nr:DUF2779 domain-containing protein [Bacteroidales bacterium]
MPTLSKSTFLRGSQCRKSLYLHFNRPELKDPISPMQQAIFSQGHEVGKLAQQLFPGGTDAGLYVPDRYTQSIALTRRLIEEGTEVIYEAGFAVDDLHCFIDILVRDGDKWKAYEVKSSTQVKPVNLLDAAFQYYVITKSGLHVSDISLVVLDTGYEREGDLDIRSLFKTISVLEPVLKWQDKIEQSVEDFFFMLKCPVVPETGIGPHCSDPYDCDFKGHCWEHIPDYSIFNISRLSADKKWELYRQGIVKFEDIPSDFRLNVAQWQQVIAELKGETHIDKKAIGRFVSGLSYPLHFLDFESFQPAVPLYDHSHPYQQIVFQYSLHILDSPDALLQHRYFLAPADKADPRIPFISQLVEDINPTGDILVFNRSFEASRLNEISATFPNFQFQISNLTSRIKDLMDIFQKRYYYVPEMKGSYSIKQVLPALAPQFSYEGLAIADGGSASHAFMALHSEPNPEKIAETRNNLLEYCKLDTLAMVEILNVLQRI